MALEFRLTRGLVLSSALVFLATVAAAPLAAPTTAPGAPPTVVAGTLARERPGLSVSLGVGYGYGLIGAQVRYDRPLRPWLHLAPFVAAGIIPEFGKAWMAGSAGLSGGIGWRHRLAVDIAVAPTTWEQLNLHGTTIDVRTFYGPNIGIGYEHVTDSGWFQRTTLGYGWGLWAQGEAPPVSLVSLVTLSLGVGMRAW